MCSFGPNFGMFLVKARLLFAQNGTFGPNVVSVIQRRIIFVHNGSEKDIYWYFGIISRNVCPPKQISLAQMGDFVCCSSAFPCSPYFLFFFSSKNLFLTKRFVDQLLGDEIPSVVVFETFL